MLVQGCADNHASRRAYGKLTIIFAFSECSMMTINNNMGLTVLGLFMYICLLQVWPSSSRFAFEFQPVLRVARMFLTTRSVTISRWARKLEGDVNPF